MRPLKLVMTGFCSYSQRTEIDFSAFGTSGLYLISGKTGSGKTTIFDAISYALFGSSSGKYRDVNLLRSDFAGPDLPTLVELTFELNEKIYYIKRNPTYQRRSKNNDSLVTETAGAELTLPDGKIISGIGNVDKKVRNLLGIEKEQFYQIVMLAQGEFLSLLNSNTKERGEIFRKIFKTEKYNDLQQALKVQRQKAEYSVSSVLIEAKQFFAGVMTGTDEKDTKKFEELKLLTEQWEEKISFIKGLEKKDKNLQLKFGSEKEENQKQLDALNIEISEFNKLKEALENLKTVKIKLENQKEKLELYTKEREEALNKDRERPALEKEVTLISNDLEKYQEAEALSQRIDNLENSFNLAEKKLESLNLEFSENKSNLEKINLETNELNKIENKAAFYAERKSKLENRKENLSEGLELLNQIETLNLELKSKQAEYEGSRDKAGLSRTNYEEMNRLYFDGQAGILGENLKEGLPCPVCGSLSHPKPAKKTESLPSKEELDQLKVKTESLEEQSHKKSLQAAECNSKIQMKNENLKSLLEKLFEDSFENPFEKMNEEKKVVAQELSELQNQIKAEEERNKRLKFLNEENQKVRDYLDILVSKINQIEKEKLQFEEETKAKKENLEKIKNGLKFESRKIAENRIAFLNNEINRIKTSLEKATLNFNECDKSIAELNARYAEIKKTTENAKQFDEEELTKRLGDLTEKSRILENELKNISTRLSVNSLAKNSIEEKAKEYEGANKELTLLSELYETASGTLKGGKAKIMLETYVQMHYFDRIIAHANLRFETMSGGQYTLVRKKEADQNRSLFGLELNVIDHYKGTERDVKTLSGGESFEASLSLALGLSDEISQNAGGIKIDTMFVDEGFGTLDESTLDKAYKALVDITEGKRLVGIISHVGYLKDKIEKQIIVEKEAGKASSVTIKA